MKKEEKVTFIIDPEKTKKDLIYDNVINNLHLTMDEQVKYLKGKVYSLEKDLEEHKNYTFLFIFSALALAFGIGLLCYDFYILGILLVITTFVFVITKLLLNFKDRTKELKSNEFDKVEELISLLNSKLK